MYQVLNNPYLRCDFLCKDIFKNLKRADKKIDCGKKKGRTLAATVSGTRYTSISVR
jgi:hypothetical protein